MMFPRTTGVDVASRDPSAPTRATATVHDAELKAEPMGAREADASVPSPGAVVGRYIVLERIGAGSMGVVMSAFDPELDRRVALKLVRPGVWSNPDSESELAEEARALARLNHPNVVAVHDVGMHRGHMFLAMEFVEGHTMRSWLLEGRHAWQEVLPVFLAAGRGLWAAHRQNLIHRDFKPENVMVDLEGRVRVMDFGLARPPRAGRPAPAPHNGDVEHSVLVGTPAYMAPEQFERQPATRRSDQFAFCVALYEALYGCRPFSGDSFVAIYESQQDGRRVLPSGMPTIPRWLNKVVSRGLALDPKARFDSLGELLDALEAGLSRRGRRAWAAAGALLVGALAMIPAAAAWDRNRARAACAEQAAPLRALYDDDARTRVATAFLSTTVPQAPESIARVSKPLAAYVDSLATQTETVCIAARQRDSDADAGKAAWCLGELRRDVEGLMVAFSRPNAAAIVDAPHAIARLTPVEVCVDPEALERAPEPPSEEVVAAIGPLRARFAEVEACRVRQDHRCVVRRTRSLRRELHAIASLPLLAQAGYDEGRSLAALGRLDVAEGVLSRAHDHAVLSDRWQLAARIAGSLSDLVGQQPGRGSEGQLWSRLARTAITRGGDPMWLIEAQRQSQLGRVFAASGEPAQAREAHATALDLLEETLPAEHPRIATATAAYADALLDAGETSRAKEVLGQALERHERASGPGHPAVVGVLAQLGAMELAQGQAAAARDACTRGAAIARTSPPGMQPDLVGLETCVARSWALSGARIEASAAFGRVLDLLVEAHGLEHPAVATVEDELAALEQSLPATSAVE
ncbi:MAG: serine/threonine-protein kinase [Myxococcota bacterium]